MNREYHRWFSHHLQRDMELLVFGHSGAKVLVFPTREGRFYDYENWGLVNAASHAINQGWLQLYCVDSVDSESFYAWYKHPADRIRHHQSYERYILNDVVPLMRSNGNQFLVAHGCSIGAFHAVNIALRHPGLFGKVVALSGRYDLTRPVGVFADLFDGFYNQDVYFNTPNHFMDNMNDFGQLEALRRTEIILAIGEDDPFRASTEALSRQLWNKGVWNALNLWPGEAHRPRYWRQMIDRYL